MKNWIFFVSAIISSGCTQADAIQEKSETSYCQIVEKTINLPELQQYFHIDVFPQRSPLVVVVDQFVSECSELKKFGTPINIISSNETEKGADKGYLKLNVSITEASAAVTFTYQPEGIKGEIELTKAKNLWVVNKSKIVEM